ncbi:DegQ family serine endoprotease [Bordetella genomosp. 13]|uniref:DegQ family serine endoprotease n=1 Tax=Bordetella genomosp. 13 TaxID=463040 RepID=UPI0011A37D95|nr:DegQ family serine endoprotease [Bordetella genomosp. 13]
MTSTQMNPGRLVVAMLAAGAIGGAGTAAIFASTPAHAAPDTQATAPVNTVAPPNFAQITRQYGPAVVNISITGSTKVSDEDDPIAQFFGQFPGFPGGGRMGPRGQREVPIRGEGSGFIISADGTILTNAHVVKDAKEVTVKLTDRREFRAKVLGSDPQTDVAVLKIDASNLPVVKIGEVSGLEVGEWVLAIGSPFGLENTATAGIVSAKGRSLPDDTSVPFIQTDVAVNPGNSGGPLFNSRGEVVGINSQIYSRTGGYQGLSFAIPIDVAYKIKDQILKHGKAQHAMLGVTAQEVNQALADSFKLSSPSGALIASVQPGSAAEKAGLRAGDVIRKVDGHEIVSSGDLSSMISLSSPGQKVSLEIWRDGAPKEVSATLGSMSKSQAAEEDTGDNPAGQGRLGLALRPLTPQEQQAVGAPGVLVQQAGGPAARAGIQPGDVILSVNGVPASSAEQVRTEVARAKGTVALLVQRGHDKIFVPVRIG